MKAKNVLRLLSEKYDEALKKYDVLVIPTINCLPPKLPSEDLNTAGMEFNITQDTKKYTSNSIHADCVHSD